MNVAWILLGVSATCWILFVYPYFLYPMILRLVGREPIKCGPARYSISLLFCAHNEVESLPDKIENLRDLKRTHPKLEILAYDDGSTDGTAELLESVPDLLSVSGGPGRTGKAAGMKLLAGKARGDILVLTDANVLLAPDALERLLPYYAEPEIGGVCGTLKYISETGSVTSQIGSLYWRLDERLRTLESRTGNVMGADGSIFSVRRSLYPDFPDTVLDDLTVSMSVIFQGKRLIKAPDVRAYEKSVSERNEELRRKIRIGARAYHTHQYLRPQLRRMSARDRFKYTSRKQIRWFGGLFLTIGSFCAVAAVAIASKLAAAALVLAAAGVMLVAYRAKAGVLAKASDALLAIFATLVGVFYGMRGRTVAIWAPAKSR